jgi:hypothetical protein
MMTRRRKANKGAQAQAAATMKTVTVEEDKARRSRREQRWC